MDWKKLVGTVAPTLATALGGPLAGLATNAIIDALGIPGGSSERDISLAIAKDPEALLKLKQANLDFEKRMKELDIDLERIHASDRDSARNRQIQVKDYTPAILAGIITFGFLGTLLFVLRWGTPVNGGDALLIMLGALGASFTSVVSYYYGSSSSSKNKDATIHSFAQR
jgi:hypothetical protein